MHTKWPNKESNYKAIKNAEPDSPLDWPHVRALAVWNRGAPAHSVLRVNVKQDFGDFSFYFRTQEASGKSCGHCTVSLSLKGVHFKGEF